MLTALLSQITYIDNFLYRNIRIFNAHIFDT